MSKAEVQIDDRTSAVKVYKFVKGTLRLVSSLVTSVFGASGAGHSTGLVPDPGAGAGSTKYLREDATWVVPPAGSGGTPAAGGTHMLSPSEEPDVLMVVGPPGVAGSAGASGSPGAAGPQGPTAMPVWFPDEPDLPMLIPGPAGAQGATGAAGTGITVGVLASDDANTGSGMLNVAGLNKTVGVGTWWFRYVIIAQSGTATSSMKFAVNHTGTTGVFMYNLFFPSAGVSAATGAVDQELNATTGMVWAFHATRAKNTTLGPQASVDTINANIMYIIEGICVVTVSGTLELYHGSEEAVTTTVMANSSLILVQTA